MKKVYIIAEVGPNHQGSLSMAMRYVKKISKIGVDAIKFQIGLAEEHYSLDSFKPDYHKKNIKNKLSIINQAKKRLLSFEEHLKLYKVCKKYKIDYISSAFDLKSLKFITKNFKFPYFKIASGEMLSIDAIQFISKKKIPIILSTGMAKIEEIRKTIDLLNSRFKKNITLLHCVSSYPTRLEDLNLNFMHKLEKLFKCPVGLSDHTEGEIASLTAVALGAKIIEKHVTLDKSLSGPDHKSSMTIEEFEKLVKKIRSVERVLGKDRKIISKNEFRVSRALRKSCVASRDLSKGEIIKLDDIVFKRPGTGINPLLFKKLIGKKIKYSIKKDRLIPKSFI